MLNIGNVDFRKSSATDSTKIYVGGILQTKASLQVIDSNSTGSIFYGRNLKITFDDGASTTLSALFGQSQTILNNLVVNTKNVYFANDIVDYIAVSIYRNRTP